MLGNLNHNWRGDKISYSHVHDWIRDHWKKPKKCEKCGNEKKLDWSNISGKYKRSDRSDWLALCRSCHMKMDMTNERKINSSIAAKLRCKDPKEKERLRIIGSNISKKLITRVSVKCQCCGKKFEVVPSKLKLGRGKHCSLACRKKHKYHI